MRIDKWLWVARFFKTRALATRACELGRITSNTHSGNAQSAKPSREVRIGDMLHVKVEAGDFEIEVLGLSEMRGPASVAQTLYRETDASREARAKLAEERKLNPEFEFAHRGRPSKRDRRDLSRFRRGA